VPTRTQQLRQSVLLTGVGLALALVVGLALVARQTARRSIEELARQHGAEVAGRVANLAGNYVRERRREAELLAASPWLVAAASQASQDAAQRGLDRLDIPTLERQFNRTRELGGDPVLKRYLVDYVERSDVAELFFTESHGYNVLTSELTSDFVQSDEDWWQQAFKKGTYEGEPTYDSSAAAVSIEYDVAIRAPGRARPVGVLKVVYALGRLGPQLGVADLSDSAYLEVVDEHGHLLVAPAGETLLAEEPDAPRIERAARPRDVVLRTARGTEELVVTVPANEGRWWIVFRQPTSRAFAAARATERNIGIGLLAAFGVAVVVLLWISRWLSRRVTEPVRAAGAIASRVASGDLSVTIVTQRAEATEVSELLAAVHTMVVALRRLVGAIRQAADEAAAMAAEISAATEQMSASTQELTSTTQDLSRKAAEQAQLVRAAADDASRILQIAGILASGSEESVRRNAALAARARQHKELLDQSTAQLAKLAEEVEKGAAEAEALAKASQEIQKFVAQAKAVATQTNMLALNAAIEAARAGPQGRGFAVVADEVRKLASQAALAAGETSDTVRGVLTRVHATRDRILRLAAGGAAARDAAQAASQGLATVAGEADANEGWSREIATSASDVRKLVEEIAARLTQVSQGTESLLAAAEEIAASSEEQSASTEEIASSANQLAEAADKLQGAVKTFRLLEDEAAETTRQAAD
jgi:methyl-accepting chemotaxis protein